MNPIKFEPIYQERPWGGRALATRLGRALPAGKPIGESWDLVDRAEAQSIVSNGPHAGKPLRSLLEIHGSLLMGAEWPAVRPFPLLVKWLDCRERLSLQVHPPAGIARNLGGEPKTENWYLAHADSHAAVMVGLKAGVSESDFATAQKLGALESSVNRLSVTRGDSIFVPSGVVHAIDAGCLILEVQQNSDTTYRVDDWGRLGLDGKPRTLHPEKSLASINWNAPMPELVRPDGNNEQVLAACPEFRLRRIRLGRESGLWRPEGGAPTILCVVEGKLEFTGVDDGARQGETWLLPAAYFGVVVASGEATIVVADRFTRPMESRGTAR